MTRKLLRLGSFDLDCLLVAACFLVALLVNTEAARCEDCRTNAVLDKREVRLWYSREEASPGVLSRGGYGIAGATMLKSGYRMIGDPPDDVTVEVVQHPVGYEYVEHDLLGTLLSASHPHLPVIGEAPSSAGEGARIIGWSPGSNDDCQRLYSLTAPESAGGVAVWCSASAETNGLITVAIRYSSDGVPEALLREYLERYPSTVRAVEISVRAWLDADVQKWIAILRAGDLVPIELQVAATNLAKYESQANEDWGARRLRMTSADSPDLVELIARATAKAEEWHGTHRFVKGP